MNRLAILMDGNLNSTQIVKNQDISHVCRSRVLGDKVVGVVLESDFGCRSQTRVGTRKTYEDEKSVRLPPGLRCVLLLLSARSSVQLKREGTHH